MPEFPGDVIVTAHQLAVDHHADAHTIRNADKNEAIRTCRFAANQPQLSERARSPGVLYLHRESRRGGQLVPYIHAAPTERRRIQNQAGALVHHAGNDDANTLTSGLCPCVFSILRIRDGKILNELRDTEKIVS